MLALSYSPVCAGTHEREPKMEKIGQKTCEDDTLSGPCQRVVSLCLINIVNLPLVLINLNGRHSEVIIPKK